MGIDPKTSGGSAHMAITYYYLSRFELRKFLHACTPATRSRAMAAQPGPQGGRSRAGMQLSWLPKLLEGLHGGRLRGHRVPAGPRAFPIYVIANQPCGGLYQEAVYTEGYGFSFNSGCRNRPSVRRMIVPIPGMPSRTTHRDA